jgi:two-component system alkaline phosphatase synthesis response regulator PhoP
MARILIVEDDPDIAFGLQEDLTRHGHEVAVARDGETGLQRGRDPWDVILLDVMLPKRDGFDVCRTLRAARVKTPVIMLTAKTQEVDKVLGLEIGADDYVTKPFSATELRARIKAVTRRHDVGDPQGVFRFGECELDFDRAELRRRDAVVPTTALEFRLLSAFIEARGRVLTRDQLIPKVWGEGTFIGDRVIDTHILNLRKKIESEPARPKHITSVRGIGYRFDG